MNRWFPFEDSRGDLRGAIEELQRRMDELERRGGKPSSPGTIPGPTDRI